MARTHFDGPVSSAEGFEVDETDVINGSGELLPESIAGQSIVLQGSAALDVTGTNSTTVASSGDFTASKGGDTFIPTRLIGEITTVVAANSTAPILTVQDASGNSSGLTLTLTDGDADGDLVLATTADGTAMTPIDLTAEDMQVKVTTAGVDSGTETGEVKVFVEGILVK